MVAFFYLLRVGEYTVSWNSRLKRTILLRKCDVRLWHKGKLIDHESPLPTLLLADSATILIANTKNGTKGAFVHHDAFGGVICLVAALARRIANLRGMRASTPLSSVPPAHLDNPNLRSGCDTCGPMGSHVRLSHGKRIHCGQGLIAQPPCWRRNGYEAKWRHGQHNHVDSLMDVPHVPPLYPLPDWGALGRYGVENVPIIHVSKHWVTGEA